MHRRRVGILMVMVSATLSCLGMDQSNGLWLASQVIANPPLAKHENDSSEKLLSNGCNQSNPRKRSRELLNEDVASFPSLEPKREEKRYEPAKASQRELRAKYFRGLLDDNVPVVELLLKNGWPVNDCDAVQAPMTIAVKKNSPRMIELLDRYGADLRVKGREVMTPIMFGVRYGRLEAVRMLLKLAQKKNVILPMLDDEDYQKKTPFMLATIMGNVEIMEELIRYGASPLGKCEYEEMTSFLWAAFKGKLYALQFIYEWAEKRNICVITDRDNRGKNALMLAALNGHKNVVDFLINKIDVNDESSSGDTPLTCATYYNHSPIVETLWYYGANIDHQRVDGKTPLMIAASKGYLYLCQLLLSRGASVDLRSRSGDTALALAANEEIEKLLLSKMSAKIKDEMLLNQARRRSAHQTNGHARSKSL